MTLAVSTLHHYRNRDRLDKWSGLWETWFMAKRKLRIVKRVRNVPVLGVCELCGAEFTGNPMMGNAQSVIQGHFNTHVCKLVPAKAEAGTAVKKTAKG